MHLEELIAVELITQVKKRRDSIDWALGENALKTVLAQAELLCAAWV